MVVEVVATFALVEHADAFKEVVRGRADVLTDPMDVEVLTVGTLAVGHAHSGRIVE